MARFIKRCDLVKQNDICIIITISTFMSILFVHIVVLHAFNIPLRKLERINS